MRILFVFLTLIFPLSCASVFAQRTVFPEIGAQIFIEPGQSAADIEEFFTIMEQNNMTVGRIRLFGAHMLRPDGTWDYSLYDTAFDAAHRHGVKLFATLFPPTDLLSDVGGFKFPRSRGHLGEIAEYIRAMVTHFSTKPALYVWVLQNEPGLGGSKYHMSEIAQELFEEWQKMQEIPGYNNGYLKADFSKEQFLIHYTDWYLNWIAHQIDSYHPGSHKHINPHQIFDTVTEYDFDSFEGYLSSMGISMHFSWHFGLFDRSRYPLGVSVMSDLIRTNAGGNPFWITEMQGGNVTASGYVPYCPTGNEISQFLWTGIAGGAEGVIFWSLNQRGSALEAGEWGMIDFYRRPSDRLSAASRVAAEVKGHAQFFEGAVPVNPPVTLLYNKESLWIQRRNSQTLYDPDNPGRQHSAPMKSLIGAYEAIASYGVAPGVSSMERFDWDAGAGRAAVITDMVSLPSEYWEPMTRFVRSGGTLVVTGLTGFYDANMHCIMMNGFPLEELFGGGISEFKYIDGYFSLSLDSPAITVPAHMWLGIINPVASVISGKEEGHVFATEHAYGEGKVIWLPSLIELGARTDEERGGVRDFYGWHLGEILAHAPVRFAEPRGGVFMRVMESGGAIMTVVVNKNECPVTVRLTGVTGEPEMVDGDFSVDGTSLEIAGDSYSVCIWNKK